MRTAKTVILVIDDDRGCRELISLALEEAGYATVKAGLPAEGLSIAAGSMPHLIVLDWHMPQMDGLQVLKKLKEGKATREIPVIMATGIKTESADLKIALDLGAVDFIRKPIDDVELVARAKAALRLVRYYEESRDRLKTIHRQEKESIRQKAREVQQELERKKRELVANAFRLVENIEHSGAMESELMEFDTDLDLHGSTKLRAIIAKYQTKSFQARWDEFEKQFEEVNTEFFKKLLHDYPFLSAQERKLCVYFKMGLENKDVAALTISSYDAVRKARLRLKKKFGLASKEELSEFLNRT